ncbi:MAG: c-type cytochrome biogenesis protein CcmI [Burkholderiales bacterium]|nr:c-type cytochrome biogenesis protein CcmI [Burkholderiales bacterium]
MTAILMAFIGVGLFGFLNREEENDTSAYNKAVYEDQINELKQDLQRGAINQQQYDQGMEEIERRVLEELDRPKAISNSFLTWKAGIPLLLVIPLLAFCIYFLAGSPSLINYSANGGETAQWDEEGNVALKEVKQPTVEELKAYVKNSPKDSRAWLQLSYLYQKDGDKQQALEAMDKAFEASPHKMAEDSTLITERAILMLEVQNEELIDKAQSELNKAIEANPENATAKEILGMIYYRKGQYQKAVDLWSQVLDLYPAGSPEALQLIDVIGEAKNRAMMGF